MSVFLGNQKIDGGYPITTGITSSSTDSEVPSAKAVYDNSLDVYSTTEQRVGTWINNKPIYRKVYPVTMVPSNNIYSGTFEISDPIDIIVSYNGYITNGSVAFFMNSPRWETQDSDITFYWSQSISKITIETKSNRSGYTGHIWLEYTKTTDTATRSLNLTKSENTGSLVGLGDTAEVTNETLEKTKLDEVTDKDVGEQIAEVKEVEQIKELEESGDKGE